MLFYVVHLVLFLLLLYVYSSSGTTFNPISYGGGAPPSGIDDCAKTHLYIDLKVFDFSYISKTKILKKKKNLIFLPHPPQRGVLKNEDFENWSESLSCKSIYKCV